MTHVFVVDENTFKYHLEYMFAGTGAKDKTSPFLTNSGITYSSTTERMLVGMIADISRIRINDKIIFYLQATGNSQGTFYGIFKVVSNPFFDENDANNYLRTQTNKGLLFRVLIKPDEVYAKGITEHEYLDSLKGKNHPADLCWSLIYRKLKGNRGCTMITDYEYEDFLRKIREKNNNVILVGNTFTFNSTSNEIVPITIHNNYQGRRSTINILPRLLFKANRGNAFETHLQANIIQNLNNAPLSNLLIPYSDLEYWIGNEVSCGVGMQRIDLMIKQETQNDIVIRLIELKDEAPYDGILKQINWYLEWLSYYVIPKYSNKNITLIPTVIAKGNLSTHLQATYQAFSYTIPNVNVNSLQYIGFDYNQNSINFTRYL